MEHDNAFYICASGIVLVLTLLFIAALILFYKERERKKDVIDTLHDVRNELRDSKMMLEMHKEKEVEALKTEIQEIKKLLNEKNTNSR